MFIRSQSKTLSVLLYIWSYDIALWSVYRNFSLVIINVLSYVLVINDMIV